MSVEIPTSVPIARIISLITGNWIQTRETRCLFSSCKSCSSSIDHVDYFPMRDKAHVKFQKQVKTANYQLIYFKFLLFEFSHDKL